MARSFKRKEPMSALTEINVTPLIDLAFALLIIFMVTTPLLEQQVQIDLPLESVSPQNATDDEVANISLNAQGQLFWGDERVEWSRLNALLRDAAGSHPTPIISIRADATLPYQRVIDVIDLVKQNQLTRISLNTEAK